MQRQVYYYYYHLLIRPRNQTQDLIDVNFSFLCVIQEVTVQQLQDVAVVIPADVLLARRCLIYQT